MQFDKHPGPWKVMRYVLDGNGNYEEVEQLHVFRNGSVFIDMICDANGVEVIASVDGGGIRFSSVDVANAVIALGGK